ncbi:unnamed protein product [Rotaria magnacalcarata]|uniref:SS18 N-terminal domain-containing protein n=1 Tax=Rotaria magnacalcarata TaxID=392030 RepID=A0A815MF90_9BILA|nr:unnamed protein product [Rotaria magnacalcarata]CAF1423530.1 unnamed protein product [Rotaria magnacalcarata]CAF2008528.1 unnamed protein product [Rotaria magnacalcarata]
MYTQQQVASMPPQQKPSIQKILDDNSQLISVILDLQTKGRQMESLEYQRTLHRNLTYLTQFDMTQSHHPNTLPPPDAFVQAQQPNMMGNAMMQSNQLGVPTSTSEQMYRTQTNSPAPSNVSASALNKSPHGSSSAGGLYPPSNAQTSNSSVPPSLQQQRSPAGSVPSPSPSGPLTSSISPQNPVMNKAPTPQPPSSTHLPPMPQQQQRPYLPTQQMIQQQQQGRPMNGTGMDHSTGGQAQSSYMQGQQSYMPQQQQHSYSLQQNGYAHHPNGGMPQQHYPMYHQQQNPGMPVPSNQIAKPNSPLNSQQQSIIPAPSSPKPSSSSSPSQATNTQNLVSNQQQQQQQQQQMAYSNYAGQQQMYHQQQQNYHMQQQQWQNQPPRMMMQPQYAPYQQGQYQQAPPQT